MRFAGLKKCVDHETDYKRDSIAQKFPECQETKFRPHAVLDLVHGILQLALLLGGHKNVYPGEQYFPVLLVLLISSMIEDKSQEKLYPEHCPVRDRTGVKRWGNEQVPQAPLKA